MSIPLLCGPDVLVPVHICVSHEGVKFIDSFTWKLQDAFLSPECFAAHLAADLCLPYAIQLKIALQLAEQVSAYREIIAAINAYLEQHDSILEQLKKLLTININVSYNTIDYKDTFQWDILSVVSPEMFARTTCSDLGLPCELEPIIAIQIREAIIRHIIAVLQGNEKKEKDEENTADTKASSDIKVSMLLPGPAVEKVTCFWKENRVGGVHDKAFASLLLQPEDKRTNASLWNNM